MIAHNNFGATFSPVQLVVARLTCPLVVKRSTSESVPIPQTHFLYSNFLNRPGFEDWSRTSMAFNRINRATEDYFQVRVRS